MKKRNATIFSYPLIMNLQPLNKAHRYYTLLTDGFQNFEEQGHFLRIASDTTEIKGIV